MKLLSAIKTYQCTQGPDTWIYCTTTEMGTLQYGDSIRLGKELEENLLHLYRLLNSQLDPLKYLNMTAFPFRDL